MKNLETLIQTALTTDLGKNNCDITTHTLFGDHSGSCQASLISKHASDIIICGIDIVKQVYATLSPSSRVRCDFQDGDTLSPGQTLLTIESDAQTILKGERVSLNFLRHLSAIATITDQFVEKVKAYNTKILDTRKTTPGLRELEKYAVKCGGGVNHRMGLHDAIMIKDTHIDMLGSMQDALELLPLENNVPVIVEVRSENECDLAIQFGKDKIDRILLDNMSIPELLCCVNKCKGIFETEASGNINLDTIQHIAEAGVDFASVGMLTHSAGSVDLSMKIHEH